MGACLLRPCEDFRSSGVSGRSRWLICFQEAEYLELNFYGEVAEAEGLILTLRWRHRGLCCESEWR